MQNNDYYAVKSHSRSFNVAFGINRKSVCDFLLVIILVVTDILSRTVSELLCIYCSNFGHLAFFSPIWGLRDEVLTMFILGSLKSA